MNSTTLKPTVIVFKMIDCGGCKLFDERIFSIVKDDEEIKEVVDMYTVLFGYDTKTGIRYSLDIEYPDFEIEYAPSIFICRAYDESNGYHLDKKLMKDKKFNKRQDNYSYEFTSESNPEKFKKWIMEKKELLL